MADASGFDIFGDFETRGYLRNIDGLKDTEAVKRAEHRAFLKNSAAVAHTLAAKAGPLTYQDLCNTHAKLFGTVYPWAGKDRAEVAADLVIRKERTTTTVLDGVALNLSSSGVTFAPSRLIKNVADAALYVGNDPEFMATRPGAVMLRLADAHPFLEGNGRAFLVVHTELARRAGISIDWRSMDHRDYLSALTADLKSVAGGQLDAYLKPYVLPNPTQSLITEHQPVLGPTQTLPSINAAAFANAIARNPLSEAVGDRPAIHGISEPAQLALIKHLHLTNSTELSAAADHIASLPTPIKAELSLLAEQTDVFAHAATPIALSPRDEPHRAALKEIATAATNAAADITSNIRQNQQTQSRTPKR